MTKFKPALLVAAAVGAVVAIAPFWTQAIRWNECVDVWNVNHKQAIGVAVNICNGGNI